MDHSIGIVVIETSLSRKDCFHLQNSIEYKCQPTNGITCIHEEFGSGRFIVGPTFIEINVSSYRGIVGAWKGIQFDYTGFN